MKNFLLFLLVSSPLMAVELHPYDESAETIQAILASNKVKSKLKVKSAGVTGVYTAKLQNGDIGWIVRTAHCELETSIYWKPGGAPPVPGGGVMGPPEPVVTVYDCR